MLQRRGDGHQRFSRDWESYRQGFGYRTGDFWLGNENLHRLTAQGEHELRIDLLDDTGKWYHFVYDSFHVASESDLYRLTAGNYTGIEGKK